MDSGIELGGLSVGHDEYASDCFELFKKIVWWSFKIITQPISAVSSKGTFIFKIPADFKKITDAESFRLKGKMRITMQEEDALVNIYANDSVSTVNNIFHSLWNKFDLKMNDN